MANIYDIPSGPKNLAIIFPDVDWNLVQDYFVELLIDGVVFATSPTISIGCCCDEQSVRILFLNSLGRYDGITFQKPKIIHDTKDSSYEKGLTFPLNKEDASLERFNVRSNDTFELTNNCYKEEDKSWIQEFFDSPKAFMQWTGIQGQSDSYIPIKILAGSFEKQKNRDEFIYILNAKIVLGNEFLTIRN